jgi:hypothetical protein
MMAPSASSYDLNLQPAEERAAQMKKKSGEMHQ